ncbi:MAG: hypothetical protein L0Y76_05490 [Ignavibacteria bacterium]|nr:hypothetical protein [Ignavibacteria bacterium]
MKKLIFAAAFLFVLAGAFLFWNSQSSVADDKDGKCCNTECPKYADCDKKCNHNCDSLRTDCQKQCDKKNEECQKQCPKNEGQSQMNNCQKKTGCETRQDGTKKSGCPYPKQ